MNGILKLCLDMFAKEWMLCASLKRMVHNRYKYMHSIIEHVEVYVSHYWTRERRPLESQLQTAENLNNLFHGVYHNESRNLFAEFNMISVISKKNSH
jgi:hypothetical protein